MLVSLLQFLIGCTRRGPANWTLDKNHGPGHRFRYKPWKFTYTVLASNDRFAGQTLTVQVTDSTSFFMVTTGGHIPITFDEILVNASTNIKSTFVDDVYIASQVTVDVKLYCQ